MNQIEQYCTFYLEGHYFGINVLEVQEVFRYQEMTAVPLSSSVVCGLINLRGQIITALDLRLLLQLEERQEDQIPMNVVVRTKDEVVSLLVDEIGDVLEVSEDLFEAAPETLDVSIRHLVKGVYKLDKELLLILDTAKAIYTEHS